MRNDDDTPGLPAVIPVPTPDRRGVTYKPRALCSKDEALFYLGYLLYRVQTRTRTVEQLKTAMVRRYGRAPETPQLLDSEGRVVSSLPPWIPSDDVRLYQQLAEKDGLQAEDEGA